MAANCRLLFLQNPTMSLSEAINALLADQQDDLAIELIKANKRTQFLKTNKVKAEQQLEIQPTVAKPVEVPVAEPRHTLNDYREFVLQYLLSQLPGGAEVTYIQFENMFIQEATMRNWFLPSDHIQLSDNKPRWKCALSDALGSLACKNGPLTREKGKRTYVVEVL